MSGQTPVAISWSIARISSISTPFASMIAFEMSISPCVFEISGLRFSVQLMNIAFRSE